MPPPPIAFGSPPDSHSAVERAQRLSRRDTSAQRRSYCDASAVVSPPVDTPPDPDEATAGAIERAAEARAARAAVDGRTTILALALAAPRDSFTSSSLLLTGLADGLAPKTWRYAAIR